VIASPHFNGDPRPLAIQGVRRFHRSLFARLDVLPKPAARERCLRDYMEAVFLTGKVPRGVSPADRRSLRNGYLRFLRGWMLDASSEEGAVLKGWVESRFGLPPVFHAGPIDRTDTGSISSTSASGCGGALDERRRHAVRPPLRVRAIRAGTRHPGVPSFRLYRGIRNIADYLFLEESIDARAVVRLNSLNSFSSRLEYAWEFGSHVFEADVPACKIFFRSDLLPGVLPRGEEESLVIGGDFDVIVRSY
jgi:NAD+--dinitrogen-reductase ADP-D-ribosyltransferase